MYLIRKVRVAHHTFCTACSWRRCVGLREPPWQPLEHGNLNNTLNNLRVQESNQRRAQEKDVEPRNQQHFYKHTARRALSLSSATAPWPRTSLRDDASR